MVNPELGMYWSLPGSLAKSLPHLLCPTELPSYQAPPRNYPNYQAPLSYYSNVQQSYQVILPNYQNAPQIYQTPQYPNFQTLTPTHKNPPPLRNNYNLSRPKLKKKPPRVFTPLIESRIQFFERLKRASLIYAVDPKNVNVNSRHYSADIHYAYHSGGAGHTPKDCKHKI
ncbi:hypothetical protein H5410_021183 [Solanum commersonii]|uniref:Uncharacterized protein n=1 Tax=Solanum commersonii TaxID=4109 RepID=A0A9J5ZGE5_SOLCO|nr:hypothetical protein H5410_021183 [Solanum commersonii]